jgi:hypothetical protein
MLLLALRLLLAGGVVDVLDWLPVLGAVRYIREVEEVLEAVSQSSDSESLRLVMARNSAICAA